MLDTESLLTALDAYGLSLWREPLQSLLEQRLADNAHGHFREWRDVIDALPQPQSASVNVSDGVLQVVDNDSNEHPVEAELRKLMPWRKGPFELLGTAIDSEWRSDWKWDRVANSIEPLNGQRVLDVGCGNGYFALRMLDAGADCVVGIDPSLLFVCQFAAIRKMAAVSRAVVLPLRLHELPQDSLAFDTVFSMGVLYHQRDPLQHLRELAGCAKPGGQIIIETLILRDDDDEVLVPEDRYARMRNVWHVPGIAVLSNWLREAGIEQVEVKDITQTGVDEQRQTSWMTFDSLADSLDAANPSLTVEGLPAPTRALLVGRAP